MGRWDHSSLLSPALRLAVVTVILLLELHPSLAGAPPEPSLGGSVSAVSTNKTECSKPEACSKGVVLPIWEPQNPSFGDKVARATVYFVALVYMFLGVSIIADRFMASIEVITSQEKEITIKKPNGETTTTTVRIWNETVSNLTLMALGSSAPEILLSVIEVIGHGFNAGTLGPSTIVGSAAFNMFVIIGLCVYVVPDGETRKVKHLRVFFVTATWSIFAYIWLYLILSVISPGVVQVWEGLLTFLFFPICVVFAWVADRRLLFYKYVYKRYRTGKQRGMIIETEGDRPLPSKVCSEELTPVLQILLLQLAQILCISITHITATAELPAAAGILIGLIIHMVIKASYNTDRPRFIFKAFQFIKTWLLFLWFGQVNC